MDIATVGKGQALALRDYGKASRVLFARGSENDAIRSNPNRVNVFLPVRRRSMRLHDVNYASQECLCFVTFNLHPRCGIRLENEIAQTAWRTLNLEIEKTACYISALCLMPDHVHLLVSPSGQGETISDLIMRFKSMIYQAVRREHNLHLKWQTSFYDHVVRDKENRAEEIELISDYIFSNPERAGLENHQYRRRL